MKPSTAALNSSARSSVRPCGAAGRTVSFASGIAAAISLDFQIGTRMSRSPRLERVAVAHADPASAELAAGLRGLLIDPQGTEGPAAVARTGRSELHTDIDARHILYEFCVDRALWTTWTTPTQPVHRRWSLLAG